MDKTIRRVTDIDEQQAETYRYWQSQSIGARLIAVSELSQQAYAFAAAFKGVPAHDYTLGTDPQGRRANIADVVDEAEPRV
jgi:hypothetical protein